MSMKNFRSAWWGGRLLEHAIARAPSLGHHGPGRSYLRHNEPSLKLFQRFGFERWDFYLVSRNSTASTATLL